MLRALAAALCVAALAAIVATGGGFDDGAWRVVYVALGFSIFSATAAAAAAAGAMLLQCGWEAVHPLGWATIAGSVLSFVTLVVAVFAQDGYELNGCCVLATFAATHAAIVTRGARDGESPVILALCWTSIASAVILAGIGITPIPGGLDDVGDGFGQLTVVLVIVWLLTFALAPILRRMDGVGAGAPAAAPLTGEATVRRSRARRSSAAGPRAGAT